MNYTTLTTLIEMRDSAIKALDLPVAKMDWKVQRRLQAQADALSEAINLMQQIEKAEMEWEIAWHAVAINLTKNRASREATFRKGFIKGWQSVLKHFASALKEKNG